MKKLISGMRGTAAILIAGMILILTATIINAAGDGKKHHIKRQKWSFGGFFGYYDKGQLQRGFKVYNEVCKSCHGLKYLSYRNLSQEGGPGFTPDQVKVVAGEEEVLDGFDEDGKPKARKGRPADRFVSPYANDAEAKAANNDALPPDLSVMAKARGVHSSGPWYLEPVGWVKDIATGYQEGGADYIYALLTGYSEAPAGVKVEDGLHYNKYFKGNKIAMGSPLQNGQVEYTDGADQTVKQYAKDVTAFLMWAADPKLEERKRMGFRVLVFLSILALLLYLSKKRLWARLKG